MTGIEPNGLPVGLRGYTAHAGKITSVTVLMGDGTKQNFYDAAWILDKYAKYQKAETPEQPVQLPPMPYREQTGEIVNGYTFSRPDILSHDDDYLERHGKRLPVIQTDSRKG